MYTKEERPITVGVVLFFKCKANAHANKKSLRTGEPENSGFKRIQLDGMVSTVSKPGIAQMIQKISLEEVLQSCAPLLQKWRAELGYDTFGRERRDCSLEVGKRLYQLTSKVVKLRVSLAYVHVASLWPRRTPWSVLMRRDTALRGTTYRERFDLNDPNNKRADICGAPVNHCMVDDLNTFRPARVIAIIVFAVLIIL
jgi:hypothetical protein